MDTSSWRFISSAFPAEIEPTEQPEHAAWADAHMHAHLYREALIVLGGTGYQYHSGKIYEVGAGTILTFDTMEPHEVYYPKDHPPARHLWCSFVRGQCKFTTVRVGARRSGRHYRFASDPSYYLEQLGFDSQKAMFSKSDPAIPVAWTRQRCVAAWALLIGRLVEEGYRPQTASNLKPFQERLIQSMVRHIREGNGCDCSLKTLAQSAHYSEYHFSRMFKQYAGMTLRECVNDARARGLKRMLAQQIPLKVIAARLGFCHASALCQWRRRMNV